MLRNASELVPLAPVMLKGISERLFKQPNICLPALNKARNMCPGVRNVIEDSGERKVWRRTESEAG